MQETFASPFDTHLIAALEAAPKTHARESMRSAVHHLRMAEPLFKIDVAMAVFRCITAVEEAASGLMLLLQQQGYPRASELKRREHLHKNAMLPFLRILHRRAIRAASEGNYQINLHTFPSLKQPLGISITVQHDNGSSSTVPINPPLAFLLSDDGVGIDKTIDIDSFIKSQGAASVKAYLKEETNLRNKILYASPEGIPKVTIDHHKFFPAKQQAVRTMICAYLLMVPYGRQPTVTHGLNAFLELLSLVKDA